tara:strand:+ start:321 stop:440 length:120 start_codon:yes stop_codon:yes gene_type:complete
MTLKRAKKEIEKRRQEEKKMFRDMKKEMMGWVGVFKIST